MVASVAGAQATLAITGARVIDGTGAPARIETVIVRGDRIVAVGPDVSVPPDAQVIRADGETLLPGLFDLHTHLNSSATGEPEDFGKSLKQYLLCGVTTVNDYSVYGEMIAPLRNLEQTGVLLGPKVNFAIRLGTPQGHGTEFGWGDYFTQEVSTPAEAHAAMARVLPYKPDVIKVFTDGWRYDRIADLTSMNVQTLSAIVEDAHRAGLKVFTHTVTLRGAKIAAQAGVDSLAHGVGDALVDDQLIKLMKQHYTGYVSTLATYEPESLQTSSPRLTALLSSEGRAFEARRAQRAPLGPAAEANMRRWHFLQQNIARLLAAGIPIGVGTDAGVAGTYHGWSTLHEMELLVSSGMTPLQAVTAGTGVSAALVGQSADRGTIAPGKIADLLLVQGEPDKNINDIENTKAVFLGGRQMDLQALEAAVQSPEPTPLPAHLVGPLIDNAERQDGRSNLDTMLVNSTDAGVDHSKMLFVRSLGHHGHDISTLARMSPKENAYADLVIPLTKGGVELADVSSYKGIQFAVRGEGDYKLLLENYGTNRAKWYTATFNGGAKWHTVKIPFSSFQSTDVALHFPARTLRTLHFELARPAGVDTWLELEDVKLY
jgi:imidazolonepropionase-like amidohydrolase